MAIKNEKLVEKNVGNSVKKRPIRTAEEKLAKIEEQEKALKKKKANIRKIEKRKELALIEKNTILFSKFGFVVQKIIGKELDEKILKSFEIFLKEQEKNDKAFSKALIK